MINNELVFDTINHAAAKICVEKSSFLDEKVSNVLVCFVSLHVKSLLT